MPELPEVETVRLALRPAMEGARFVRVIARRPDLRDALPVDFVARLQRKTVRALTRRAKYLIAELSSGEVLVMHLGMSGSFRIDGPPKGERRPREEPDAHDHIVFHMSSGKRVTFNDPRRFGSMTILSPSQLAAHKAIGGLGPEPLDPAFDAAALARACRGKKTTLKAALLDQRVVAGLGNIYVSEALHRARLSPKRRAATIATASGVPRESARLLVDAIKAVLNDALEWGARSRAGATGELGYFEYRFRVYDREGQRCLRRGCGGTIARIVQGGRSTFYCPNCQK